MISTHEARLINAVDAVQTRNADLMRQFAKGNGKFVDKYLLTLDVINLLRELTESHVVLTETTLDELECMLADQRAKQK